MWSEALLKFPVGDPRKDPTSEMDQGFCVRKPVPEPVRQELEGGADIPDDFSLREIELLDSRRLVADVNDLRSVIIHDKGRLLDGFVTDRDDEISLLDGFMDVVSLGKRGSAQI